MNADHAPRAANDAAWLDLYRAHVPDLYRSVSRRVGGDRTLAEDMVQETWLRALRAWRRDAPPASAEAWLRTTAFNLIRNHFRDRRSSVILRDEHEAASGPPEDGSQRTQAIQWCLARLRPVSAELLAARYFDGLGVRDLAMQRGCSERAIEGRLARARAELQRQIERHRRELAPWRPELERLNEEPQP